MSANASTTVLITGGTGFTAQHCIHQALVRGYKVRTTVRSLKSRDSVLSALKSKCAQPPVDIAAIEGEDGSRLEFIEVDLRDGQEKWEEVVKGCKYVLHVACPSPAVFPKNEQEVIEPAEQGTLRMLRAAAKVRADGGLPQRVIVTSSIGTIGYGHSYDEHQVFDETDWSVLEKLIGMPKAKMIMEKSVWKFDEEEGQKAGLEVATINVVGVFGPPLGSHDNISMKVVKQMLQGKVPACPRIQFGVVDVRDVAALHLAAMTSPAAKGQRYIASNEESVWLSEFGKILQAGLKDEYPQYARKVPTKDISDWLVKGMANVIPMLRGMTELGWKKNFSSQKARSELGWSTRSNEEVLLSAARTMIEQGDV